jgi:NodT family efflux transporter outer membrane factor (OMF) lipoprotein
MFMKKHHILPALLSVMLLAGCAMVGPNFTTPVSEVPEAWSNVDDPRIEPTREEHANWWQAFNDPALNALIEKAYEGNLGLQIAGLRVYEARAALGRVEGFLYPQSQRIGARVTRIELSENAEPISNLPDVVADNTDTSFSNYGVGIDAIWELDFWGRYRRGIEAADANLAGSIANYDDMLVTLTGEVASAYVILRTLEERLAIAQRNVDVQKRSLKIADVRFRNGITTELDVQQAKALLYNTESLIPFLEAGIVKAKHVISLLLGQPPGQLSEILSQSQSIPVGPESIAVGVPGELLRRRPDVRRAEMMAAAQSNLIGVAKADLYPAFRLVGSVGYVADSTGDIFESDSFAGVGGFGVMYKFLNYGRLKNNVRIQDARFQQLVTAYQLTVLAAAREVDDALVSFLSAQEESRLKANSATAAERAVELALILYRDGVTDYTTVLDTQRIQLLQQDALVAARSQVGLQLIAAYKALGGGWQMKEDNDLISAKTMKEMEDRTDWGQLLEAGTPGN